jgi:hypothetical protein
MERKFIFDFEFEAKRIGSSMRECSKLIFQIMQYDNFSQTFAKSRDNMHWDIIDQILHLSQVSDQSHILDI